MSSTSIGTWVGVVFVGLLVVALGLFASPLFAIVIAALVAGAAMAYALIRREQQAVSAPGTRRSRAVTPEGKPTSPTGRSSGAPASGEG